MKNTTSLSLYISATVGIRKNVPSPQESFIVANEHGKRSVCSKEVVVLDTKHRYTNSKQ